MVRIPLRRNRRQVGWFDAVAAAGSDLSGWVGLWDVLAWVSRG